MVGFGEAEGSYMPDVLTRLRLLKELMRWGGIALGFARTLQTANKRIRKVYPRGPIGPSCKCRDPGSLIKHEGKNS